MKKLSSYITIFFSFEFLLILFLNAGRYKADPRFAWVPVDLTVLFLVLGLAAGVYILVYEGLEFNLDALKLNFIFFVFAGYVLLSLLWTPGRVYAREKALYIVVLVYWPLFATSVIVAAHQERFKRFLILFVFFSMWIAEETFLSYQQAGHSSLSVLGGNYLGVGRVLGPAVLIILGYVLYVTRSVVVKILGTALMGFLLYLLLVTGGRGPLLATLVAFVIPLLASISFESLSIVWVKKSFPYLITIIIVAVISILFLMNQKNAPATLRRMNLLLQSNDMGGSADTRLSYYTKSIQLWIKNPFIGYGVGSWPLLIKLEDVRDYPHNIIIETLFEFGIVGLSILGTLFGYALRKLGSWSSIRKSPYRIIILMIFVNALFNAFISGDISDNRFLFAALGFMILQKTPAELQDDDHTKYST